MQSQRCEHSRAATPESRWTQEQSTTVELNHRIANSLQLVCSFLSLQERDVVEPAAKTALRAAASRVAAVAMVHRALLKGEGKTVDLGALLSSLCTNAGAATGLSIVLDADSVTLPVDVAEGAAIVVNELILNAAKHAYSGGAGEVLVSVRRAPSSEARITVADHGPGIPGHGVRDGSGVGMTIMDAAVHRVGGSLSFDSRQGTRATLVIPAQ